MFGGPSGGVPALRVYALRSLRTCAPEQVCPSGTRAAEQFCILTLERACVLRGPCSCMTKRQAPNQVVPSMSLP